MIIYMEFRSCSGGAEASAFAEELIRAYMKYANKNNVSYKIVTDGKTKTISFLGKEKDLRLLSGEGGVHKVQRVSKGKLHTSTVSIAVFGESDNKKEIIQIERDDLKIEKYRSSGPGGQHKNTTDSAIRITHLPTGIVVCCDRERSQTLNKEEAIAVLEAKLIEIKDTKKKFEENTNRQLQVKNGERSEARRIYNFPRDTVTDIATGKTCTVKEFFSKANLEILGA